MYSFGVLSKGKNRYQFHKVWTPLHLLEMTKDIIGKLWWRTSCCVSSSRHIPENWHNLHVEISKNVLGVVEIFMADMQDLGGLSKRKSHYPWNSFIFKEKTLLQMARNKGCHLWKTSNILCSIKRSKVKSFKDDAFHSWAQCWLSKKTRRIK